MPQKLHADPGMPQNVLILHEARAAAVGRRAKRRTGRDAGAMVAAGRARHGYILLNSFLRWALLLCGLAGSVGLGIVIGLLLG